jgi:CRISPR-associated protein (TIGR02710 family)
MKVLLVTVGGSHQPIVTSIASQNPDRVVFICSVGVNGSEVQVVGAGKPCEVRKGADVVEQLPNIPTQVGLGDRFDPSRDLVRLTNLDDLSDCYGRIREALRSLRLELPDAVITADYTGGTKTMSAALVMAAVDLEVPLMLTTAKRTDLVRVVSGERTRRATTSALAVERTIAQLLPLFLAKYNYAAAIAELSSLFQGMELAGENEVRVQEVLDICEGLEAWDRFDHRVALDRLLPYMGREDLKPLIFFLKRSISSRGGIDTQFDVTDGMRGSGYEVVEDLRLNADRRVVQQRFDDAVGRLYRAIELLVQIRLRAAYGIETGDVDMLRLPEGLREGYETRRSLRNGKIQIGLFESYNLLSSLPDDPLGKLFAERKGKILAVLEVRNHSLFAHGFQPIDRAAYQEFAGVIAGFIEDGIAVLLPKNSKFSPLQFPTKF